jgi:hypothetical protein
VPARHLLLIVACLLGAIIAVRAERTVPQAGVNCAYRASNDLPRRLQAEENCLSQLRGVVERIGNVLEIKLGNGETKTFFSNFEACENSDSAECIHYWLTAYLPKPRAVVLEVGLWEGVAAKLVNIDSGNVTELEEEPHPSPSGDRFAVIKASEHEKVEKDIAIYTATSDPPVLEFAYSIPEGTYALYSFVRWEGDTRIKLKVETRVNGKLEEFNTEAIRTKAGWQLRGPAPGP